MPKRDLLIEIGVEEMPAPLVAPTAEQLKEKLVQWLSEKRIPYDKAAWYGTPRRSAVLVHGVSEQQEALDEQFRGPARRIAVDEQGDWTKAALGFARGKGVATDALFFQEYKGEAYVYARKRQEGQATVDLLAQDLERLLTSLSFPTTMRWGSYSLRFIRPIRWLVTLYGSEVIPIHLTGVRAGNMTRGHRFLGAETELQNATEYAEILRRQYVLADPEERKSRIRDQLRQLAHANGWNVPVDDALLDEVTYLVEYPTAVSGSFDPAYLEVPEDVLITSMREHQRYFPVKSEAGELLPHFITVRNGDDTSLETVVKGNEKVLRARLADALFFYKEDQKHSLSFFNEKLEHVVFHEQLGTIADKVRRIRAIAVELAEKLGYVQAVKTRVERTAQWCKFDLETLMVDEFPELQGRMGETYARIAGEEPEVAEGIFEHYLPRYPGDDLPSTQTGIAVGLADKIDTIAAFFGIGIVPTGSEDPYGLRRQATGITQVIWKLNIPLTLDQLIQIALDELERNNYLRRPRKDVVKELGSFFQLRLKHLLQNQGIRYDVIESILQSGASSPQLAVAKSEWLMRRLHSASFKRTVEAFTRVENLAAKAEKGTLQINEALLQETAERQLATAYFQALRAYDEAEQNDGVRDMYEAIASLEPYIDAYFDEVMVMVEDLEIRHNRLTLLRAVSKLVRRFAHFNEIVIE